MKWGDLLVALDFIINNLIQYYIKFYYINILKKFFSRLFWVAKNYRGLGCSRSQHFILLLMQVLSCDIYQLFKNNYFGEHLWISPSKRYLERDSNTGVFQQVLWIIQEHLFCRESPNGCFWNTRAGVSL